MLHKGPVSYTVLLHLTCAGPLDHTRVGVAGVLTVKVQGPGDLGAWGTRHTTGQQLHLPLEVPLFVVTIVTHQVGALIFGVG